MDSKINASDREISVSKALDLYRAYREQIKSLVVGERKDYSTAAQIMGEAVRAISEKDAYGILRHVPCGGMLMVTAKGLHDALKSCEETKIISAMQAFEQHFPRAILDSSRRASQFLKDFE